jgi:preprotein translocase subunit SecE
MSNSSIGKLLKPQTTGTSGKKEKFNLIQYLKESRTELKKVSWPTRKETWKNTWVVIGLSLGVAAFLGIWDYLFNLALEWYLKI